MMWYCRVLAGSETFGQISQKRISFLGLFLILIIFLVSTVSCAGVSNETGYLNYAAADKSLFSRITFEYPETWNWVVYIDDPSASFGSIYVSNPDTPEDSYRSSVDMDIALFETPTEALSVMEADISKYLKARKSGRGKILSDQVIEIDGYSARQITSWRDSEIGAEFGRFGPFISEQIYVLVGSSYFTITFHTLENERQSEFGQEFDRMIETIQFLP